MTSRERPYRLPSPIYPIIDAEQSGGRAPLELGAMVLEGGARMIQLRAKHLSTRDFCDLAKAIQAECMRNRAALIVNDRADIARIVGAAGVHLGQTDLSPVHAREILGGDAIIGLSTHNLQQVRRAAREVCVDYIGFGPVFQTASKANADSPQGIEGVREARALTELPIVAIGGIDAESATRVLAAGADAVAMIGAIATADDAASFVRALIAAKPN